MHLVVAHFNESLEWLSLVPDQWRIFIYSKGDKPVVPSGLGHRTVVIKRDNAGREGDTFLSYITRQYDNLPMATAFVQGNPFDHCSRDNFFALLDTDVTEDSLIPLADTILSCGKTGEPNHAGLPLSMAAFQLGIPVRWPLEFAPGAMWIAGRNRIRTTVYQKYTELLAWLHENPINGYCLERYWPVLFGCNDGMGEVPWVIYYTHHKVGDSLMDGVWNSIWNAGAQPDKVVVVADRPDSRLPSNVHTYYMPVSGLGWQRAIYHKIRLALLQIPSGVKVAMAEHDVLYPDGYFTAIANTDIQDDIVYYWTSCIHADINGAEFFYSDKNHTRTLLSGCFGDRDLLLREVNKRIAQIEVLPDGQEFHPFEPGLDGCWGYIDRPDKPILDIRHGLNATNTGTDKEYYEPFSEDLLWGNAAKLMETLR